MPRRSSTLRKEEIEALPLSKSAQCLLEECRMILPGIQAIFGFQLMGVFSQPFDQKLTNSEQRFYGVALALLALAMILIMTPAAYHRQTGIRQITERFLFIASRLLLLSMLPLGLALLIDIYLVTEVIFRDNWAIALSVCIGISFIFFWVVLPRSEFVKQIFWAAPASEPRAPRARK